MATVGRKGLLSVHFQATVHNCRKVTGKESSRQLFPARPQSPTERHERPAYPCSAQLAVFTPTEFRVSCRGDSDPYNWLCLSLSIYNQDSSPQTRSQAKLIFPQSRLSSQVILDCGKLTFPMNHHTSEPPQLCHLLLAPGLLERSISPTRLYTVHSPSNTLMSLFINKGYISRKAAWWVWLMTLHHHDRCASIVEWVSLILFHLRPSC